MNRREFLGAAIAAGVGGSVLPRSLAQLKEAGFASRGEVELFGGSLNALLADCRDQLFERYLPFWEQGGIDEENGGFMCYLYDDGSVENDRKDIWYQGRGIWVYSYLYNELDRNPKWLEIAREARDFMVDHMHLGMGVHLS